MEHAVILHPNDLDKIIQSLKEEIRLGFEKSRATNIDPPLSRKQIAKWLGISVTTLDERFKKGEYPSKLMHGKGRNKVFYASEFDSEIKKS